jgi:hypothetical protein
LNSARVAGGVLALYVLVLAGLLVTGVYYGVTFDPGRCSSSAAASSNTGLLLAALAVLSFGAGRLLGHLRRSAHTGPTVIPQRTHEQVAPAVMWSLAGFLLLVFVLLVYETAALAGVDGLRPISSYVRCAATQGPGLTALATATVGSLLGSWIWYPTR